MLDSDRDTFFDEGNEDPSRADTSHQEKGTPPDAQKKAPEESLPDYIADKFRRANDPIVEQAAIERRPFVEKYPGSLPARAVVALAHKLSEPPPIPPRAA